MIVPMRRAPQPGGFVLARPEFEGYSIAYVHFEKGGHIHKVSDPSKRKDKGKTAPPSAGEPPPELNSHPYLCVHRGTVSCLAHYEGTDIVAKLLPECHDALPVTIHTLAVR